MKENLTHEILSNPKVATGVSTATTGTGIATWLNLIPDDIGKLASLVGAILSIVLIYTVIRRYQLENEHRAEVAKVNDLQREKLEIELAKLRESNK